MKKNLFGLAALALAIVFSAFTIKPAADVYMVYDDSGPQNTFTNYSQSASETARDGSSVLAWFKIPNDVNGVISSGEFATAFEEIDQAADGDNSLNDEPEGNIVVGAKTYVLELKN